MLHISVECLTDLAKEARSREAAHPRRTYDLSLHPCGIVLRVSDRNPGSALGVDRLIQLDALAMSEMNYATQVFDEIDAKVERAMAELSIAGRRSPAF